MFEEVSDPNGCTRNSCPCKFRDFDETTYKCKLYSKIIMMGSDHLSSGLCNSHDSSDTLIELRRMNPHLFGSLKAFNRMSSPIMLAIVIAMVSSA